ncbi:hypothetical protein BCR36DRAFT_11216 [Piromyces finnis]|uniref:DUF202 domain-containing protein n=1 Tax=Piromyces finnis TaxID=1754191 RepID=A0A1Y1VF77_9FUNG|nr:hypothetical protein BCR36DRAFT_11216 [Piromyces finnis]|eukprot:ORX54765.1 hypothetical protein BCR36DRAFT_11216 [Piromyces finnis]
MSVSSYKSLEEGIYKPTLYDKIFRNTRVDRFIDHIIIFLVLVFVTGTFIFLIIEGIRQRIVYIFIALCLFAYMYCEIKLVKYYRKGELESKFKKLILGLGFSIVLQCAISICVIEFHV